MVRPVRCPLVGIRRCAGLTTLHTQSSAAEQPRRRPSEIAEVKKHIRELVEGVVEGRVDRGRASVAFQGLGVLKGFIEVERKIKETQELEQRIAELEQAASSADYRGGRAWGR